MRQRSLHFESLRSNYPPDRNEHGLARLGVMTIFAVLRVKEKVAVIVVGDAFDIEDGVVVGDIVVNVNGGAVGTEISIAVRDLVVNVCAVVRVNVVSVDANSVELHPKYFEWMKPLCIVTVSADDV